MGTHHPDGIFIMVGPGVQHRDGAPMSIVDTTSIAAYCTGLAVPSDFEGKIPADLFAADWLAAHPVQAGPATEARPAGTTTPVPAAEGAIKDAEEQQREEVLAQLRLLGYIED